MYGVTIVRNFAVRLAFGVCMSKVKSGGKKKAVYQQLPIFNELTDPQGTEEPAGKITPEQAHAILKEHGMDLNLEQAATILCYLRRWATISLTQTFKNEDR